MSDVRGAARLNLADLMEANADAFPDRLAVACGDVRLTFGELDARATRVANAWAERGIGEGDHVGLYLYNCHEYLECMLAAWKLRARTINVNYRYVAEELRYIVQNAELAGLIYEASLKDEVEKAAEGVRMLVARGPEYDAMLEAASPVRDFPERSEDDLMIIYTGGTTGMPRGVMWRHADLYFAALQAGNPGGEPISDPAELAPRMKENGDGLHVHTAPPLIHGSSQLASWIALLNGGIASIVPGRSFDPVASLDACDRDEMHTLNLVGDAMALPLVKTLEAHPGRWDLKDLTVISSAGAVLSNHVRERIEELLPHGMVLNSFGASETGHQGIAIYEDGKMSWFMDDTHTKVLNPETLEVVAPGEVGIISRFGHVPLGYYGDPEKTAKVFKTKDGVRYVLNGDMATYNDDGDIVFLGRGSVCINTGGEKVYAEEVEEALKHHPAVFDAVVCGLPDDRWGQRVEALVTLREGQTADVQDITAFCRTKVAGYKVPKQIWVVKDLNRQPSGKPDYRWAREHASALGAST